MEDEDGMVGVALSKVLVRVAGVGLRQHISTLAPYVLPVSELLRYVGPPSLLTRREHRRRLEEADAELDAAVGEGVAELGSGADEGAAVRLPGPPLASPPPPTPSQPLPLHRRCQQRCLRRSRLRRCEGAAQEARTLFPGGLKRPKIQVPALVLRVVVGCNAGKFCTP
jgi:hypothetical protein